MTQTKEGLKVESVKPTKVYVKQFRRNSWLPEGHDGEFRYTGTTETLTVQNRRGTKELITGLTNEVQRDLETRLNLPGASEKLPQGTLSRHNVAFWSTFRIAIPKEGKVLNVAEDPWHELEWRVLLAHQEVAKSEAEKLYTPFARYVLTSDEEEAATVNRTIKIKSRAYAKFRELTTENMKDFLRVYGGTHELNMKISDKSSTTAFIEASVGKIVEEYPERFLDIAEDPSFKTRNFIYKCIEYNLIKKDRTKYALFGGDIIGYTTSQAVDYFNDKANQEVVATLKARLSEETGDKV